jgi:hypothetical protein
MRGFDYIVKTYTLTVALKEPNPAPISSMTLQFPFLRLPMMDEPLDESLRMRA